MKGQQTILNELIGKHILELLDSMRMEVARYWQLKN
jgi:hypothetical protein